MVHSLVENTFHATVLRPERAGRARRGRRAALRRHRPRTALPRPDPRCRVGVPRGPRPRLPRGRGSGGATARVAGVAHTGAARQVQDVARQAKPPGHGIGAALAGRATGVWWSGRGPPKIVSEREFTSREPGAGGHERPGSGWNGHGPPRKIVSEREFTSREPGARGVTSVRVAGGTDTDPPQARERARVHLARAGGLGGSRASG